MWKRNAAQQTATDVQGTANMLAAAEAVGVKAFVHTSSTSAYSQLVEGVLTETVPQRGGENWINYEVTKYHSEKLVKESRLPWIVFTPSHILGPGDRHNWARLIMMIDQQKLLGIPPGVPPEGARMTSYTLLVDSSKAERELGYVQTPQDALQADTLAWMKAEGMVGRWPAQVVTVGDDCVGKPIPNC